MLRKKQKQKIIELLSSIEDAHENLKELLENRCVEQVMSLLEDCQNAAVTIGNFIEEFEGEGTQAVTELEEYCELLYNAANEVECPNASLEIYETLKEQIKKAFVQIRYTIPVKYEVVFLPYQSSMWDSFETIWMEAENDKNCNCHVIPIPYYDKNPNGSFGDAHFEKDMFPDYVPITDYRQYDIKAIEPDVIFIHNPYDKYNYITSVHPMFYSSVLKKYTELLVYVPYFISNDNVGESVCLTQGVLNSNIVVLQSEKVRERYIKVLQKALGLNDDQFRKTNLKDKYMALGSPKFDKLILGDLEGVHIPEEWLKKIYY